MSVLNKNIEFNTPQNIQDTKNFFNERDVLINLSKNSKIIIPINRNNIISNSFILSKINDDSVLKFNKILKDRFGNMELNNELTQMKKEEESGHKVPLIDFSDPLEGKMAKSIIKASEFYRLKYNKNRKKNKTMSIID